MLRKITQNLNRRSTLLFLPTVRKYFSTSSQAAVDLASKDGEMRIFLVAGEVSGDAIGSRLMAALKKLSPYPIRVGGVGGSMMAKQGLKSLFPMEDIAVMGIWELLPHLKKLQVRLKETVEAAISFRPHVVVTIDSKGFSFRLLKQLKGQWGNVFLQLDIANKDLMHLYTFITLHHLSGPGKGVKKDSMGFLSLWIMSCASYHLKRKSAYLMECLQPLSVILF